MTREETCCFTGHRIIARSLVPELEKAIEEEIEKLYAQNVKSFVCGGAIGFDTLAAGAVLRAKKRHPDVTLVLALPCPDQTANWSARSREIYEKTVRAADVVHIVSSAYDPGCMHRRNRFMADMSSHCVYYLEKNAGGTFSTVEYARKKGLTLHRLVPGGSDES